MEAAKEKTIHHKRSVHRKPYDFTALKESYPKLDSFLANNKYGNVSLDFKDPKAVKALNTALLSYHYDVKEWDIPDGYLCPGVPGRADYIHNAADLLAAFNNEVIPKGKKITCLDVGAGANCVYPLIGARSYGWNFIATDVDQIAIDNMQEILRHNPDLDSQISTYMQKDENQIFDGVLDGDGYVDLVICNPPYYASEAEAIQTSTKKYNNLHKTKLKKAPSNFGGRNKELWCEGGELYFILKIIRQSKAYAKSCLAFSSLVSDKKHLDHLVDELRRMKVHAYDILPMQTKQKSTRILAWTFMDEKTQSVWVNHRWKSN